MWMEQLEARRLMSGALAMDATAPEATAALHAPLAATMAVPKLPRSYTGSMSWKSGNDQLVFSITKQTPSANGRVLWLTGSLLQIGISESFAVSAKVDLRTRAVTGKTQGIAAGTLSGTFNSNWTMAEGQFTSFQQGRSTRGTFRLAKPKALPYDLRGIYQGRADDGTRLSLTIAKQAASGLISGTATSGGWRFAVVGLVDANGDSHLRLSGDGVGYVYSGFRGGGWRTLDGSALVRVESQNLRANFTLRRR